ncbi:MAG: flagellar biosynthesis regulator FlaF [Rhodoblastus sp.]
MYRNGYAEIAVDDQVEARRTEIAALNFVIVQLETARDAPNDAGSLHRALDAMETLWSIFMADAAHVENALPKETRRNIISIARWLFVRSAALRGGNATGVDLLIEINCAIRNGLESRS